MNAETVGRGFARGSRWFVGVATRGQTYRNLLYLLLTFPFGIAYFVFLVTGFTTSAVLMVVFLIGIPMLAIVMFLVTQLTAVERGLAVVLLDADIRPSAAPADTRERLWRLVFDLGTWKGLVYLFSKFFIGIATFVAVVVGLSLSWALLSAPLHYRDSTVGIHVDLEDPIELAPAIAYQHDGWAVDLASSTSITLANGELVSIYANTLWSALALSGVGVVVLLVVLHLLNGLAWLSAKYAELMLSRTQPSILSELSNASTPSRPDRR